MSAIAINNYSPQSLINQGFQTNPSGVAKSEIKLSRRGRLARTFVVLSLAVVMVSLLGARAGAGTQDQVGAPTSFIEITVAPGDTLWSLASRLADNGDPRSLVDEITSVNSLGSSELQAGQKLRIPLD
jgi:LysM repeat protein